jgi:hypothetical protein
MNDRIQFARDRVKAGVLRWVLGLLLVTFIVTVWPTAFRYHRYDDSVVRENRFSGKLQFLAGTLWVDR